MAAGIDPCGACRIRDFIDAGVHSLKIVGRNHSKSNKISDVKFLKAAIETAEDKSLDNKTYIKTVKRLYNKHYKVACNDYCYYPL